MKGIALGTVQFGINYGISNTKGQIDKKEVEQMLDYAYEREVKTLDTARIYGESEKVIGEYLKKSGKKFTIVTKIKPLDSNLNEGEALKEAEESVLQSLKTLGCDQVETILLHDSHGIREYPALMTFLQKLKKRGLCKKIGISGYDSEDDKELFHQLDVLQYPCNLFDHNLIGLDVDNELFIRSVFLQGLFFLDYDTIMYKVPEALPYIKELNVICSYYDIRIDELAMGFCKERMGNAALLLGVNSIEQLKYNLELYHRIDLNIDIIKRVLSVFQNVPKEVINPSLWKKR